MIHAGATLRHPVAYAWLDLRRISVAYAVSSKCHIARRSEGPAPGPAQQLPTVAARDDGSGQWGLDIPADAGRAIGRAPGHYELGAGERVPRTLPAGGPAARRDDHRRRSVLCSGANTVAVHLALHIIERFGGARTGT